MNKEFIKLSDGNIAVTNENGNIKKRTYDNNYQEVLLAENKIELIDDKIKKLDKDLREQEAVVFLSKWMLISLPILVVLITLGMFIYGGLSSGGDFLAYAIYNGVKGLMYSSIAYGVAAIYYSIVKPIYKKKVKKTNAEITIAKKLKEDYEKELLDIKEKQISFESSTITMNEPVSLIQQTNAMESQIYEEINKTYTKSLNQQSKKLVLRRKK